MPYHKVIFSWFCGAATRIVQGGVIYGRSQQKCRGSPAIRLPRPFFRSKKSQAPYLQTLVFSPHLSSSPGLRIISSHTAFSGFPNDRLSSNVGVSTHTVAVPSGILTRFSILLRGCYHSRRHSNGIFTYLCMIHDYTVKVNRKG